MAYRHITRIVITGAQVFGRAFREAMRQAVASQRYAAARTARGETLLNSATSGLGSLSLDEAYRILNVSPLNVSIAKRVNDSATLKSPDTLCTDHLNLVSAQFKKLFDLNNPSEGGSFYLQSKILRARQRIEIHVKHQRAKSSTDATSFSAR